MLTIQFLRDYSGPLTNAKPYMYGEAVTLSDEQATVLAAEGVAVLLGASPVLAPAPTKEDPFQVAVVTIDRADGIQTEEASDAGSVLAQFAAQADEAPEPTIKITGPISDAVVRNETTGEVILRAKAAPAAPKKRASKKAAKP